MEKIKHKNYDTAKLLIEGNQIKRLSDVFSHLTKSVVAKDLGINYIRFEKILKNTGGFKLDELYSLAALIGVDEKIIIELAHQDHLHTKKKK